MPEYANTIGALFIWLIKGCKTKLKDEIKADTWVNYVAGYVAVILFIALNIYLIPLIYGYE